MAVFGFDHPEAAALITLLTAEMLKRGYLACGHFNPMLAHEPRHVDAFLTATKSSACWRKRSPRATSCRYRGPVNTPTLQD